MDRGAPPTRGCGRTARAPTSSPRPRISRSSTRTSTPPRPGSPAPGMASHGRGPALHRHRVWRTRRRSGGIAQRPVADPRSSSRRPFRRPRRPRSRDAAPRSARPLARVPSVPRGQSPRRRPRRARPHTRRATRPTDRRRPRRRSAVSAPVRPRLRPMAPAPGPGAVTMELPTVRPRRPDGRPRRSELPPVAPVQATGRAPVSGPGRASGPSLSLARARDPSVSGPNQSGPSRSAPSHPCPSTDPHAGPGRVPDPRDGGAPRRRAGRRPATRPPTDPGCDLTAPPREPAGAGGPGLAGRAPTPRRPGRRSTSRCWPRSTCPSTPPAPARRRPQGPTPASPGRPGVRHRPAGAHAAWRGRRRVRGARFGPIDFLPGLDPVGAPAGHPNERAAGLDGRSELAALQGSGVFLGLVELEARVGARDRSRVDRLVAPRHAAVGLPPAVFEAAPDAGAAREVPPPVPRRCGWPWPPRRRSASRCPYRWRGWSACSWCPRGDGRGSCRPVPAPGAARASCQASHPDRPRGRAGVELAGSAWIRSPSGCRPRPGRRRR